LDQEFRVECGWASDAGKVRADNQDAVFADDARDLSIVADGMGAERGGDLAARIVTTLLPRMVRRRRGQEPAAGAGLGEWLRDCIRNLSADVRRQGSEHAEVKGMGASMVLALIDGGTAWVAHLGDSRAYLCSKGRLSRLTRDHNVAEMLVQLGQITPEEARRHPGRGTLSRYVGMEGEAAPEAQSFPLLDGDRLLLCSDGLYAQLDPAEMLRVLEAEPDAAAAARGLVEAANAAGGKDNETALVVSVGQDARPGDSTRPL
jgi:serine/threonine protein phosphatase PrpC